MLSIKKEEVNVGWQREMDLDLDLVKNGIKLLIFQALSNLC